LRFQQEVGKILKMRASGKNWMSSLLMVNIKNADSVKKA
jgi:hypothetical protein